jgi:two-component system OmpR family response regulator
MTHRVLLIDDDVKLARLVSTYLEPHGVHIEHAPDGPRGLERLTRGGIDLVLLDLTMPGLDGLDVCKRIREKSRIPIIMLTARGDETDRIVGLELGADDYMPKPYSPRELLARMRAVLRRSSLDAQVETLRIGGLEIDVEARDVRVDGRDVELTALEHDLLVALMRRAGRVVKREDLLTLAGRTDVHVADRTLDVHVSHLRQKLGDDPKTPRFIHTVRGVGYVLAKETP